MEYFLTHGHHKTHEDGNCARELLYYMVTGKHADKTPECLTVCCSVLPILNDGLWRLVRSISMKRAQSEMVKELAKFIIESKTSLYATENYLNRIICEWLIDNNIRVKEQNDGSQ
jgi:adenylylsulfate kinase-like enzyme